MADRRDSRLSEVDEKGRESGFGNIDELAKEARQTETKKGILGSIGRLHVPLLGLAPSLLVSLLTVLIVPVCYTLITTGNSNTQELATNLLTTMMASAKSNIKGSLDPLKAVNVIGALPQVDEALNTNRATLYSDLANQKDLLTIMATAQVNSGTDSYVCYTADWRTPYQPGAPVTKNTAKWSFILPSRTPFPPYTDTVIGVSDESIAPLAQQYKLNQETWELGGILRTPPAPFERDVSFSKIVRILLNPPNGTIPTADNVMSITVDQTGYWAISMCRFWLSKFTNTYYGCAATFGLSSTWSAILKKQKVTDDTVLAVLSPGLKLLASSARVGKWTGQGAVDFSNETFSPLLEAFVNTTYQTATNVPIDEPGSFREKLDGKEDWIILVSRLQFTSYDDDIVILVSATPRRYVYEKIDKAAQRAMALSIGLGVGIVLMITGLFVAITIPLLRLGKAMKLLTKLDFGALEKGRIMEVNSHISEVRNIQATFTTMVKAFAGGIKKNREMIARTGLMSGGGTMSAAPSHRPSISK